jgi:sugar lactone lactonase YvrE
MNIEIVFDAGDGVGESPLYKEETQSLYWVDIIGKKIRSYNIESGRSSDWSTSDFPTALALEENGQGAVVAVAGGINHWDGKDGFEPLVQPDPFSGHEEEISVSRLCSLCGLVVKFYLRLCATPASRTVGGWVPA